MDIVVLTVGSLAALLCGWFALQIFFKLVLATFKMAVLASLAYFAAQLTWVNAEIPEVSSTEVTKLIRFVENKLQGSALPSVKVKFNYPEPISAQVSKIGYTPESSEKETKKNFF